MSKAAVASRLTEHLGLTKAQAQTAVDLVLDGIERVVLSKGRVTFVGFGAFALEERPSKAPKVAFLPAKDFLQRVETHVAERRLPTLPPATKTAAAPAKATSKRQGSARR